MHPLFQVPSTEVTLPLVEDFINLKIRESLTVEYKRAGDKPIEAVAALANTYGGLLFVGVAEGDKGVPSEITGVPLGEKERLVNQMGTSFDPPWSPEVIEVPCNEQGDKVVLVVRIDRATVPRPIVLNGSIFVRLDARNEKANRQMMRMLLDDPNSQPEPRPSAATRSLYRHESLFVNVGNNPDVALRASSALPLWQGRERTRFPSGLAGKVTEALQDTGAHLLLGRLGLALVDGGQVTLTSWQLLAATSRRVKLRISTSGADGSAPSRPGAQLVCTVSLTGDEPASELEVLLDSAVWLPSGVPLGLDLFLKVFDESVPIVANTLLPVIAEATIGINAMPVPLTEIHVASRTRRDNHGDAVRPSLDEFVSLGSLGERVGSQGISHGGETLLRSLVDPPRWDEAVREALVTMAMDWGFPDPKFP
ncbi:AlbA family DNA-binding domain-containing protein [Streptomyces hokutonensis]|uniref:AlbA family DNA-binding domain-containing protein n=1 Tax=Streptomyces hokutonensis TaxID=1306990 RepID=UPI00035C7E37|nr:ATP-binding protein [Streptomyces hokutonensis]